MNQKILLTSAGLQNPHIGEAFVRMLNKPVSAVKILFIPTAAISAESLRVLCKCIDELYGVGITAEQIVVYSLDRIMSLEEIEKYDAVYVAGGNKTHLLGKVNQVSFAPVVKDFVVRGGLYVGASAGSIPAAMIGMVNCQFTGMHAQDGSPNGPVDFTTRPEIRLTDNQALIVDSGEAVVFES